MFELTTTASAASQAVLAGTPRELAGRFSDIPEVALPDYHQYSILVEDFKGVIIFTAMFAHAFVAATATSKINLDLRDDDFLLGYQDSLQFKTVKAAAAGIRLKRTAEGVQATVPLGQLTRIQRTPELLSRRLGGDVPALRAFMQGLRLIHPSLTEPGPIDFEVPAARVFKNHKGFVPDWIKLELTEEGDQDPAEMLLDATRAVRFMGRAIKDVKEGIPYSQLMKLPDGEFVGYARQHIYRLAEVYVAGVYDFPAEVVEHVTQTELPKVRLQYFSAFLQSLINITLKEEKSDDEEEDNGEGGANNYTETLNPISTIARATQQSRLHPVKRTNDDGLLVTQRGHFRFIPEVGVENAVRVENEIELGSTTAGGEFTGVDLITPEKTHYQEGLNAAGQAVMLKKRAGRNEPVFTDWYQGKFTYTTDSGVLKVDDLNSCRPATATHMRMLLQSDPMKGAGASAFSHLGKALNAVGYKLVQHAGLKYTEWFAPDMRSGVITALNEGSTRGLLSMINSDLARKGRSLDEKTQPDLYKYFTEEWSVRYGFALADITQKSPVLPLRLLAEAADYLAKNYEKRLSDICEACGVHGATLVIAICIVISKYAPKHAEIKAQDEAMRKVYTNPTLESAETFKMPPVPFVKNATLIPHQVKIFTWLKNLPPAAVIDVQAGGGKTIVALLDIAMNMKAGKVKRPLIMCPADLMKNYFIDANKVFGGRVNIIAISTVTVNSWGFDKLRELIRSAPANTICITGFEFLSGRSEKYGYGTVRVNTSANLEFLREFDWDGLWVDEVHKLKNVYSVRTRTAMQVASTVKIIRQMSGTYLPDTNEDVVALFAQIEPTVFGDLKRFNEEFKDPNKGRGAWIPNAGRHIRRRQEEHSNIVTIKRREWKALLPPVEDGYYVVPMDPDVQIIYERLVEEQIELIRAEINEKNPKLKKALESGKMDEEEEEELENFLDGSIHIARLEEFLCDPLADEAGFAITDERKAISPKIKKVHELILENQRNQKQFPGKVLVFAKNHIGANAVYKYAPPELKRHILLYKATGGEMTKDQYLDEFEKNPEIWALVGVEDSLNTGRNLQFCNRLIRIQAVWNWGALEQGEARVLRPNVKSEFRKKIFIDLIIVNNSIDVTKTSRMIAKLVETIKWYESEDPRFQNMPALPQVSMSLKNIAASNSFTDGGEESLKAYIDTYQDYRNLEQEAYEDFLKDKTRFTQELKLPDGGVLPGSAMLKKVPYIPGIDLYGMEELGLIKFTTYESEKKRKTEFDPTGLIIHTEDGEGECTGMSDRSVRVRINGKVVAYNKDTTFVVTRKTTNVREAMARLSGADATRGVDPGRAVKELPKSLPNKPIPNVDKTANQQFKIFAISYNEWIALGVDAEDPDVPVQELRKAGFKPNRAYYYTELKTWRHLAKWLELAQKKVTIADAHLARLNETLELWKHAKDLDNFMKVLTPTVLKDFLRMQIKPVGPKEARPYLIVDDGTVYLCIDSTVHRQSWPRIKSVIVSGIAWDEAQHEMFLFCANRQDAKRKLADLAKQYTITDALKTSKRIDQLRTTGK